MKRLRSRIATTHVDLHGERFTREALEMAAQQLSECYIPVLWNHDIRIPPIGRTVSAEVVELPDGEYALDSVGEYWDRGDQPESLRGDGRSMVIHADSYESFGVRYDRSFRHPDGQALIQDLSALPGVDMQYEGKKAADPLSVLVIAAGVFALGGIGSGFLGKFGADLYDVLKGKLTDFLDRNPEPKRLLDFELHVESEGRLFEVHVLLDEVSGGLLQDLTRETFSELDETVRPVVRANPLVSRIVVEWKEGKLHLRYAVGDDCVPFLPPP